MLSLAEFRAGTIDDFLAYWLSNAVLPAAEQKTFDHYYRSYRKHFGPYVRHWYRAPEPGAGGADPRPQHRRGCWKSAADAAPNPCGRRSRAAT